jgi:hypothetical protein
LYDAILRHHEKQGLFAGFEVEDAAAKPGEPKNRRIRGLINAIVEDTRGTLISTDLKKYRYG